MKSFRVFIASPEGVADERGKAAEVIQQLNNEPQFRDAVKIQPIGWDQPGMGVAMTVGRTPQDTIALSLPQPRDCDLLLVLLWSRMGTMLPESHRKADGTRYYSGTEWEYWNALEAFNKNRSPDIWLYLRQDAPQISLDDPEQENPEQEDLRVQWLRLQNFLEQMKNSDGSIAHGINRYQQPESFRRLFEQNLRNHLIDWLKREEVKENTQKKTAQAGVKPVTEPLLEQQASEQWPTTKPKRKIIFFDPFHAARTRDTGVRDTGARDTGATGAQRSGADHVDTGSIRRADMRREHSALQAPPQAFIKSGIASFGQGADQLSPWRTLALEGQQLLFRWISAGQFQQGSPSSEPERRDDETHHLVQLSQGFWLSETTLTQAFWQVLMGSNPSEFRHPNQPVEQVSWGQTQEFCALLSPHFPLLAFRLPTEAEWEYACRAGSRGPFHWGDQIHPTQANYDGHFPYQGGKRGQRQRRPMPVKSYPANDFGLYEMHGNVWEWCADWYSEYEIVPRDQALLDPVGPQQGTERVARGGSWLSEGGQCRSAHRSSFNPQYGNEELGFRLVMVDQAALIQPS